MERILLLEYRVVTFHTPWGQEIMMLSLSAVCINISNPTKSLWYDKQGLLLGKAINVLQEIS